MQSGYKSINKEQTKLHKVTKRQWDREFESGKWDYLDLNPAERIRHAIISMFSSYYFPKGSILDVGCGFGTLADFLSGKQKSKYLGIDISSAAVRIAKQKRGTKFLCIDCENYKASKKFDIIVFNECLYYLNNRRKVLKKYLNFLESNGILIFSVYSKPGFNIGFRTLNEVRNFYTPLHVVEVRSKVNNKKIVWHIEVGCA